MLPERVSHNLITDWSHLASVVVLFSTNCSPLHSFLSPEGPLLVPEPGHSPTTLSPQVEELDPRLQEFESDPPNWRELASPEALSSLKKKETKRQEVINGKKEREKHLMRS